MNPPEADPPWAGYQLDLRTPGILPTLANSRKQMRHNPKRRKKPCARPHFQQRRTMRVENFGLRFDFAICDSVAIGYYYFFTKGKPS